ncbi:GTPase-activating protein [Psychrosphaera ytuae]|uniref:Der GTPase-activating protein YihI n=1 Tax=Psychrosphaera ytuae TaxID=2820710 RepID=A0A975DAD7_9GAMM|nr:Der GTPase-activating protein YihI [Psychrosphaera ytuae]QTH63259.1 GTPase-activating protein [Psychrosphaera ytuae]
MTRRKKSRKVGQIGVRKQETRPADTKSPRKKKAPKGQQSGNRNSLVEDNAKNPAGSAESTKKDPRVGSKKPISLIKTETQPKPVKPKLDPKKAVPTVKLEKVNEPQIDPQQELERIESDERLIELAERAENGELLTGKDAKYFNKMMDRHAELLEELGIETEEESDPLDSLDGDQWNDLLTDKD